MDFAQRVYAAAAKVPGMLTEVIITPAGGVALPPMRVGFSEPDEMVLGGEAFAAMPTIQYATADLPDLAKRDTVTLGARTFKVVNVERRGDGQESRASLEKA